METAGPSAKVRVAYADPPYPGASDHYRRHPDYGGEVDQAALITRLVTEFPDGWALSTSSTALRDLLPLCPPKTRIGAWTKRFVTLRRGINPVYAWEPVLFYGGRKLKLNRKGEPTNFLYDWISQSPPMNSLVGSKPDAFSFWVFGMLGLQHGDTLVDLYPGTGAVARAWERWQRRLFAA